jgi:hypothetical protein
MEKRAKLKELKAADDRDVKATKGYATNLPSCSHLPLMCEQLLLICGVVVVLLSCGGEASEVKATQDR